MQNTPNLCKSCMLEVLLLLLDKRLAGGRAGQIQVGLSQLMLVEVVPAVPPKRGTHMV